MVQISALPAESEHCDFFEGVVMKRKQLGNCIYRLT